MARSTAFSPISAAIRSATAVAEAFHDISAANLIGPFQLEDTLGVWPNPRGQDVTISVAIVGGGPAGLTLAAALAQQGGFEIALFERADDRIRCTPLWLMLPRQRG